MKILVNLACLTLLETFCTHYFPVCCVSCWWWHDLPCPRGPSHHILWHAQSPACSFSYQSQASPSTLQELTDLSNMIHMAAISTVSSFYQNSKVIERFCSRISFRDELNSLNNFKCHVKSFLDMKEKAGQLGVTCFLNFILRINPF